MIIYSITGINTFPDRNTFGGTNISVQNQLQIQADYVLPIGKSSQFEAGYKGNFNDLTKILASQVLP
jgi:hypothetical protein